LSFLLDLSKVTDFVSPRFSKVLVPWLLRNPRYLRRSTVLIKSFHWCSAKRKQLLDEEKLLVPPVMILSITNDCNLQCQGCFVQKVHGRKMELSEWQMIVNQAKEIGVFAFLIAGGEPFLVDDLLTIVRSHQDRVFAIFTNATTVAEKDIQRLEAISNTMIVVSLEGDEKLTDQRRGIGVYQKAVSLLRKLSQHGILSGVSVTITTDNYTFWMEDENIDEIVDLGAKLCFFIEYITAEKDEKSLSCEQRNVFREKILHYKETKPIFIIHSPGDEEPFGGCVSAGRGFVHVNAFGDLTPCPVSSASTHNLRQSTLREALNGELLKEIRQSELLEDGNGPCSLIFHEKDLMNILQKVRH